MSAHTPGPWRVTINGGFHDGMPNASVWIEAETYTSIASLIPHKGVEGNAHLIAAAPDLLAALKAVCAADDQKSLVALVDVLPVARAAIAKAEGISCR